MLRRCSGSHGSVSCVALQYASLPMCVADTSLQLSRDVIRGRRVLVDERDSTADRTRPHCRRRLSASRQGARTIRGHGGTRLKAPVLGVIVQSLANARSPTVSCRAAARREAESRRPVLAEGARSRDLVRMILFCCCCCTVLRAHSGRAVLCDPAAAVWRAASLQSSAASSRRSRRHLPSLRASSML